MTLRPAEENTGIRFVRTDLDVPAEVRACAQNVSDTTLSTSLADNGIQIFGGHGFIREYPVEMWFRNVRTLSVLEGLASV